MDIKKIAIMNNDAAIKPASKVTTLPSVSAEIKPEALMEGSRCLDALANYNEGMIKHFCAAEPEIKNFAFDGDYNSNALREEMREHILSQKGLCDDNLQVGREVIDVENQLPKTSKYYSLGGYSFNKVSGVREYFFTNLKEAPDKNGLRSKTPLNGKRQNTIKFRLEKIKEAGIGTIIDFRSEGECSKRAKQAIDEVGLRYFNFPIEDGHWTKESLDNIAKYIKVVNEGDFLAGCANGEARTDLAMVINYIFNKEAKNVPDLHFGAIASKRVSIRGNVNQILNCFSEFPEMVKKLGFDNYEDFLKHTSSRLDSLMRRLKF